MQSAPAAGLQMMHNWEEWLMDNMVVLPFRGTSIGWRSGLRCITKFHKGKWQILHLCWNNTRHQHTLRANILDSIRKSTASRAREVILHLCLALVRPVVCYCLLLNKRGKARKSKEGTDLLEQVSCRAKKMIKRLKHLSWEQAGRAGNDQPEEKEAQRRSYKCE